MFYIEKQIFLADVVRAVVDDVKSDIKLFASAMRCLRDHIKRRRGAEYANDIYETRRGGNLIFARRFLVIARGETKNIRVSREARDGSAK